MRHLLFALMLALLPLRGWAGDAMATQMAVQAVQAVQTVQAPVASPAHANPEIQAASPNASVPALQPAAGVATGMPPDCAGHGSATGSDGPVNQADSGCENCSACQACHSVALSPSGLQQPATAPTGPQRAGSRAPFASADAAAGQKPPIS